MTVVPQRVGFGCAGYHGRYGPDVATIGTTPEEGGLWVCQDGPRRRQQMTLRCSLVLSATGPLVGRWVDGRARCGHQPGAKGRWTVIWVNVG